MAKYFKSDDSFLRKLAVGAAGVKATIAQLKTMGFNPIELERGSTSFKIWKKIKIKRVRVPDILCLDTGLRFESRGKTKLEISMSHSLNDPKRSWDSGLRDNDYVSVVLFDQQDDNPANLKQKSPVHFIRIADMRQAFLSGQTSVSRPKGIEEGSEIRVKWNCSLAKQPSIVAGVEAGKITLNPVSGVAKQTLLLNRNQGRKNLSPQIRKGDVVEVNQIIAAIIPIQTELQRPEPVTDNYFIAIRLQKHLWRLSLKQSSLHPRYLITGANNS